MADRHAHNDQMADRRAHNDQMADRCTHNDQMADRCAHNDQMADRRAHNDQLAIKIGIFFTYLVWPLPRKRSSCCTKPERERSLWPIIRIGFGLAEASN